MATKPSTLPRWSDVSGTKTAPSSGQQDTGYGTNAVPTSGFLNWLFNLNYKWIQYLDAFLSDAHTWTALQTFSAGISIASLTLSGALNAASAAITGTLTAASATLSGVLTAASASLSGALTAASATISGAISGSYFTSSSNPSSSTGVSNRLHAKNICKAWGTISGGTQLDGFNCTMVVNTGPSRIDVTFATPMANANYAVAVSGANSTTGGTTNRTLDVESRTANGFSVRSYDSAGAGQAIPAGTHSIVVYGAQ